MKKALVLLGIGFCLASVTYGGEYLTKDKQNKKFGEPTEDMALVYVLRPSSLGAAIKFWVFADDQVIGATRGKSYAFALVPEGEHLFWAKAENTSTLQMEVVGGRTYYLKVTSRMGFGKARVKLSVTDEADAQKVFKKAAYAELTEEGRVRAAEIAANRLERAQNKEAEKEKWEEDDDEE